MLPTTNMKKLTNQEFLDKAKNIHGNRYDYSKVLYTGTGNKVNIICNIHGEFSIAAHHHLEGRGCYHCGRLLSSKKKTITLKEFVERGSIKYNNEHTYEKSIYTGCFNKIIVTCKIHGDFKIDSSKYLNKPTGCPKCKKCSHNKKDSYGGFTRTDWINNCGSGNSYLYLVRIYNDSESFYKIGISKNTFKRISCITNNYNKEILFSKPFTDHNLSFDLEHMLHRRFKSLHYFPKIKFIGHTECFKEDPEIYQAFKDLN